MAATPHSDLDDFVNESSPPGRPSRPTKAVPFSGGDKTTNLAVYEPDSTHVPRFKQAWNYRVMRAGGIDDYDLELQVRAVSKHLVHWLETSAVADAKVTGMQPVFHGNQFVSV
jgi:hypothetical protein